MKKVLIWGASGHAEVVADIIRLCGEYEIIGFLDDVNRDRHGARFCGATIVGGRDRLAEYRQRGVEHLILAFGDCKMRLNLSSWIQTQGFSLATAIHPRAVVASSAEIAPGVVVAAGVVINPSASIGVSTIINTCASVDHECRIGNAAHICPGVCLAGKVIVGQAAWIGIGAVVKDRVHIGDNAVVGAGAVVISDVPASVVAFGIPAKFVREVVKDDD